MSLRHCCSSYLCFYMCISSFATNWKGSFTKQIATSELVEGFIQKCERPHLCTHTFLSLINSFWTYGIPELFKLSKALFMHSELCLWRSHDAVVKMVSENVASLIKMCIKTCIGFKYFSCRKTCLPAACLCKLASFPGPVRAGPGNEAICKQLAHVVLDTTPKYLGSNKHVCVTTTT